jgi:hypothetical protein
VYPVAFSGAFAVGIALDGEYPIVGSWIVPLVDKSYVAHTLEIGVIE